MAVLNKENAISILAREDVPMLYVKQQDSKRIVETTKDDSTIAAIPNVTAKTLGDSGFKKDYNLKYALVGGAMANGIASAKAVIALGKNGFLGSFGAGGLSLSVVSDAIDLMKKELGDKSFLVNMLAQKNSSNEMKLAKLLIDKKVRGVEASAYIRLTAPLVYYRVKGLRQNQDGSIEIPNHVMAKVSREEIFQLFFQPPDEKIVKKLLENGEITEEEARLSQKIPMADDITVEGDSGGHTDNRALIVILPGMIALRDQLKKKYTYAKKVRVGAAGGIGTGLSAHGAFALGADYVVTGSINQSCVEAGTSEYVKSILATAKMADVGMASSADMFEQGGKVQVLKKTTMFAQHANSLYNYYIHYNAFDEIPQKDRDKIEKRILKKSFEEVWQLTKEYLIQTGSYKPELETKPKAKMAFVFRWYLGNASRWAVTGEMERQTDMQIWCGTAIGAFNEWVAGTSLEEAKNRSIGKISYLILHSAAYYTMLELLKYCGIDVTEYEEISLIKEME